MESNTFVSARTEIQFYHGESCVQTNLPLPRNQDVYYWEAKMFEKPVNTTVAVGVATKPYPHFRLPGWNRHSLAYFSDTGHKHFSNPFQGRPYGATFEEGDVVGVGYRHRTGTIFFTRNGRRLEDACSGLRWNLFPTLGANGPCQIHVNLGQRGFVFVEANVKKWGLAPMHGTLAPPPAYGYEAGSLLLQRGINSSPANLSMGGDATSSTHSISTRQRHYDEDDEEQPLIQIQQQTPISIHQPRPQYPTHSPPAYSTFPRSPAALLRHPNGGRPIILSASSSSSGSSSSSSGPQ
ncbi:concanavalin A-like lectin/glucanase domain-containing protein [Syncephalastrum racemosum]|uniref:Concanavalin A-like lectin/glucanase domain-containing protein n=1 Tax=Syncephalastrum racemosum TaxID=13706 RepID=A0A1X2H384_SYNRA|nr:concanavalin A-like lectin/glucanase domain-containing protein [Syncephalastrum racemosum]